MPYTSKFFFPFKSFNTLILYIHVCTRNYVALSMHDDVINNYWLLLINFLHTCLANYHSTEAS